MSAMPVILLVDDEPHVRAGLRTVLRRRRRDWGVLEAEGPDAAEALLDVAAADAVITDITMPGRDGLDLLRSLRARPDTADLPVVVLTGLATPDLKRRCLELGATDFLDKPADPDELVARMDNMLRLKAYQDAMKAQNAALERMVEARTAQLREANLELIWRLAHAAEARDNDTGQHVLRVGLYSRAVGAALGLGEPILNLLQHAALLHDVGKIAVPDAVLNKPGLLTPDERRIIERHCGQGHDILTRTTPSLLPLSGLGTDAAENPFLRMASNIALCHHERWDGSGYPHGLAGEDIPLEARIVAVADVFDALTSDRVYRDAVVLDEALDTMAQCRGHHFDPAVYDAFADSRVEILAIHACHADAVITL
ncbi:MAG TPA: response regulator [Candidatus Krumholzibacteria bacterium]|nr:response regulator [Candidatus Krumholzibacteria bacterium]HRX49838.1 response regulator [Candidatus Krumholzibacteria bacterium]